MSVSESAHDHVRQIFTESFSVSDIAESLISFDTTTSADDVWAFMDRRRYAVVGVRRDGRMAGYVTREQLGQGPCGDFACEFDPAEVVADSTSFPEMVKRFGDRPRLFVLVLGQVGGIVTRSDLQKPPVRMWLFGMVTIIEMALVQLIETHFSDDGWKQALSESRLAKAEALLEERRRRNQDLDLMDCLQFSDKGQIVLRTETLRQQAGFVSRRKGEETVKALEKLRNNLAHSQDIISCDWEVIVRLSESIEHILTIRAMRSGVPARYRVGAPRPID